jgi:hypothetical protein
MIERREEREERVRRERLVRKSTDYLLVIDSVEREVK